jgi:ATP-dependent helicase HrpB
MPDPRQLPIYEIEPELLAGLRAHGRAVVQAPTGSGKSTQVPQMLWRAGLLGEGQVVVLQPRRLAARMLARRVAEEMGVRLGEEVGYQVRLDARVSDRTRLRFVTEGILLRQMTFDPQLRGVSALVFDEFHERHLDGDIGLARALQLQRSTRPDLLLLAMSATLDTRTLADYLAPAAVVRSEGRTFPVRIEYLAKRVDPAAEEIWEVAARVCAETLPPRSDGDALVFMPGAYEIARTVQALEGRRELRDFVVLPLHGELPPEAQDLAVARHERRKVIVATNVAETSLTIDGVTVVVDSGLARVARFDPHRGIDTLLVEKISMASADQRAGRAGRTAPGVCVRLWTEREHAHRAPQELPEVKRRDLAEVVLALQAAGIEDINGFPWIEQPEERALARATRLLLDLGAITPVAPPPGATSDGADTPGAEGAVAVPTAGLTRITALGRRMLKFPVHPRYARMLLEAEARGCVRSVALMAALTQGRSFWLRSQGREMDRARDDVLGEEHESDFFRLMRAWRWAERNNFAVEACRRLGLHAQAARQVGPLFAQFLDIARDEGLDIAERRVEGAEVRKCVLAGFVDQLARRLDRGTLRCELVHGRRGMLARESAIDQAPLLVAAEISEIGGRDGEVSTVLSLATAVEEAWLQELYPDDWSEHTVTELDPHTKRVVVRRERRFRDLTLASRLEAEPPPGEAAALLAREVLAGRLALEQWDERVEQWIVRVNRLAEWFPELEVNPIGPADRATLLEQVCYGCYGVKDLREVDPWPTLRDWLLPEQHAALERLLPERLEMPNGRRARLTYAAEGPPVLSARIQELFGIERQVTVGAGRVVVKIEILGPNQRPLQVTDDLERFWRETYPELKPALQRRYPRHEWR